MKFSNDIKNMKVLHWSSVKDKSLSIASIFTKFVKLFIDLKLDFDIDFSLSANI